MYIKVQKEKIMKNIRKALGVISVLAFVWIYAVDCTYAQGIVS